MVSAGTGADVVMGSDTRHASLLVGRERELALVGPLLDALSRGRGGILWLEGEAGIGKSALADELVRAAAERGATGMRGWGDELLRSVPLRLLATCLGVPVRADDAAGPDAAALREIAALLRGDRSAAGAADPVPAAMERMLDLVDRRCARGPMVLVAEDLQWADRVSLQLWNQLAYAVDEIPLLLVGTYRPGGPSRAVVEKLREGARARGAVLVRPGPLAEPAVNGLVERIVGGAPRPGLSKELARADGNPLYLRELLRALVDARQVVLRDAAADFAGVPGAVPGSLAAAISARLDFLGSEVVDVLRTAALLGAQFDAGAVAVATGLPMSVLANAIMEAEAAGVVEAVGERLAFRHELVQRALVELYSPLARRARHARIARALAEGDAAVRAVAAQLTAAPDGLEDWALDWLARVPRTALGAVPEASAELLARAVRLAEPGGPLWAELADRLAQILLLAGRDDELVEFATLAAEHARDPELSARLTTAAVRAAARAGRPHEAIECAQRALALPDVPLHLRARLAAWKAVAHTTAGQAAQGHEDASKALIDAEASEDPLSLACAHHAIAFAATAADGIEHIDEALAGLGFDEESMDLRVLLTHDWLIRLLQLGLMEEYEAAMPEVLTLVERVGTPRATSLRGAQVEAAFLRGDWDAARLHLEGIDGAYISTPDGAHLHGLGAVEALHRADRDRAASHLAAIEAACGPGMDLPVSRTTYLFEVRALHAEADGDPARALALLATWLETEPGMRRDERLDETPYLVRLALDAGDRGMAHEVVDAVEAAADAERGARGSATARFCRAQYEDDENALAAVAEFYRDRGWPLHAGAAWEEAAVRAARSGEIARARGMLNAAVQSYAGLCAQWDIGRADARLRSLGVRRGPRSARIRERNGWRALTASELKIARLVGAGCSNPDIAAELGLSKRTVQTHVSNILGKLQVHSRVEVVRALAGSQAERVEDALVGSSARSSMSAHRDR